MALSLEGSVKRAERKEQSEENGSKRPRTCVNNEGIGVNKRRWESSTFEPVFSRRSLSKGGSDHLLRVRRVAVIALTPYLADSTST